MTWTPGNRLIHRFNPELGPGLITAVEQRTLVVHFPDTDTVLRLAADSDAISPLRFLAGTPAVILSSLERVVIAEDSGPDLATLTDGRVVTTADLWPAKIGESLTERLELGDIDPFESFSLRLDALHLAALREADGLGSFLGGRVRLFPHQLYAAESATKSAPTRWLLADEVGLGKTVEACLILNHLLRTGQAARVLIIAPDTLTVQWLGELWRKYHQVFVLLDEKRMLDVEKEYGPGFNPFHAYQQVVVGLDFLVDHSRLTTQAVEAGIDLLIVDEAHHLKRQLGHPGNRAYRAIQPITQLKRHVVLLSATPLEEDAFGFFRLLELLRPEEFSNVPIPDRIEGTEPLPPCTSSARREAIKDLPPRVPVPVDLSEDRDWSAQSDLEIQLHRQPARSAVRRKAKLRRLRRALESGSALIGILDTKDQELKQLAVATDNSDPRLAWLCRMGPKWKQAGQKTLIFAAHRETLELIKTKMRQQAQLRVGLFHEDLSPAQRDIEVAQFRVQDGPSILVSTECGGEGRNFEFCTRLVLFDLPWNPTTVEQRIGRLDRIGRRVPVEIVYFRPSSRFGAAIARLYESLGLFQKPLGGMERRLDHVQPAIEEMVLSDTRSVNSSILTTIAMEAQQRGDKMNDAALHELHRHPYRSEMAESILSRLPDDLEELIQEVVLASAEDLNLDVEEHQGGQRYSIELGSRARVDSLPGVPAGSSFLGTFDREEAVQDESIDFFSSGHPLVEGILEHLDDARTGRVAFLHLSGPEEGFGLLALYKNGPTFNAVAIDHNGRQRPEWANLLTQRPIRSRRINAKRWITQSEWPALIRRMVDQLNGQAKPVAVAAFRLDKRLAAPKNPTS
ncbi:MAG: hypothetical protein CL484_11885 [Acidobacteria bacterium]|nr:hypothetical protein [Acidobacteriota bacterium]